MNRRFWLAVFIAACAVGVGVRPVTAFQPPTAWPDPGTNLRLGDAGRRFDPVPQTVTGVPPQGPSPATLAEFVALAERNHPRLRSALAAIIGLG